MQLVIVIHSNNFTLLENKKAIKLIDNILQDLDKNGINTDSLIDSLKELRSYALEEQVPLVVKVLRYTYEHIEQNDSFLIPIPDDEPIEDELEEGVESEKTAVATEVNPIESLKYLVSLTKSLTNKTNISDLKSYRDALVAH